jgi:2-polyprenyl-6-methoxyphenol hydroxylase-like FAD-dependent oxidoreductase
MTERTTCCVVGCGPAGAMLGLMLARTGVEVVVLEKYADFFRDFRGDTIHASTLQVLDELGLLEGFEELPQQHTSRIMVMTDDGELPFGDFTHLPGRFQYISFVPQWDFLNFVTDEAARHPSFRLLRQA